VALFFFLRRTQRKFSTAPERNRRQSRRNKKQKKKNCPAKRHQRCFVISRIETLAVTKPGRLFFSR
jgi:hypothetical protein